MGSHANGMGDGLTQQLNHASYRDYGSHRPPPHSYDYKHQAPHQQIYRPDGRNEHPMEPSSSHYYQSQGLQSNVMPEAPQERRMIPTEPSPVYYNPSAGVSHIANAIPVMPGSATGIQKVRAFVPMDRRSTGLMAIPPDFLISPESSSHIKAILSFVNDPGDFFLTLTEEPYGQNLLQIQHGLTAFFSDASKRRDWSYVRSDPPAPVAALFSRDGFWYRAIVTSARNDDKGSMNVQFVDYGNEESIPSSDVMFLPERFANASPILAIRCCLKDAVPFAGAGSEWSRDSRAFMEELLEEHLICIFHGYDPRERKFEVELINPQSGKHVPPNVLGALRSIRAAAPAIDEKRSSGAGRPVGHDGRGDSGPAAGVSGASEGHGIVPGLDESGASSGEMGQDFDTTTVVVYGMRTPLSIPAESGEYLDVLVSYVEPKGKTKAELASDNQGIFVNMIQEVPKLEKMAQFMSSVCPKAKIIPGSDLIPGTLVAAKFGEGIWHRAILISKHAPGHWKVYFVDIGNREVVSATSDMVELPKELLTYPPQAIRCKVLNIPDWVDSKPLLRTRVTIQFEDEGRRNKSFVVRMWYLDPKMGALDVGQELSWMMNRSRNREVPGQGL